MEVREKKGYKSKYLQARIHFLQPCKGKSRKWMLIQVIPLFYACIKNVRGDKLKKGIFLKKIICSQREGKK